MINLDIDPDIPPSPTNHPILHSSPTNAPPSQNNDRQEQNDSPQKLKASPLKDPFLKKHSIKESSRQNGGKGQDEGSVVDERLKALAKKEARRSTTLKYEMRTGLKPPVEAGAEGGGDSEDSSEIEDFESEEEELNVNSKKKKKRGWRQKKKKEKGSEWKIPMARRILIDDVAKQRKYYGKDHAPDRVLPQNKFVLAIARIIVREKDPEVSKVFRAALEKVNPEPLKMVERASDRKKRDRTKLFFEKMKRKVLSPFDPNSFFVLCISLLLFITIIYEAIFSTYLVTFPPKGSLSSSNGLLIANYVADFLFFLRVLINFRIAFYYKGELQTDFRYIAIHYVRTMLWLDVFSLLNIIGYFFLDSGWRALMALAAIRLYKIPLIIGVYENYFQVSREIGSLIRVLKLILVLFLYAHLCACAMYAVGYYPDPENNWIVKNGFEGEGPGAIYVITVYWSAQTISTVGYGDITPEALRERMLLIAIFIFSAIVLGYIISTIASILIQMSSFTTENWEKIRLLKKYMDDKGLKKETQERIMKYVRFYLGRENVAKIKDSDMMQFLSDNLKDDIIKEVNVKLLSDCYMFSYNFGRPFLLAISKELIEKFYGPEEFIYRYKENTHSAYFVLSGRVELVYGKGNIRVAVMEKTNTFGSLAFFLEAPRATSAKSLEFTTLFELPREVFMKKLKEYPCENEAFCLIKDNIGLYRKNSNLINVRCYLCNKTSHLGTQCPIVHWYKSPLKVITKYLINQDKFRRNFLRGPREKFSALGQIKAVQKGAERVRNTKNSELKEDIKTLLNIEAEEVESYSSMDEVFDRNIYDPEPLILAGDSSEKKELEVGVSCLNAFNGDADDNEVIARQKVEPGAIQTFVTRAYDAYLHNLNLDQVKSFEIYFPHNNVGKILGEMEAARLRRIAKAHHLPEIIIKNFKFGADKQDPRTMRKAVGGGENLLKRKSKKQEEDIKERGVYRIPARYQSFSSLKSKQEDQKPVESPSERLRTRKSLSIGRVDDEDLPVERAHSDDGIKEANGIVMNKEDRSKIQEDLEKPLIKGNSEEEDSKEMDKEVNERSEESVEYCKKVLGSEYDQLMRKFTDMLADSMKKVNDESNQGIEK